MATSHFAESIGEEWATVEEIQSKLNTPSNNHESYRRVPEIKWYTDLFPFVKALDLHADDFSWLCTGGLEYDFVAQPQDAGSWLSATELRKYIEARPVFAWGVLSAISFDDLPAAKAANCYPYADGNRGFWTGCPKPQHPLAAFEVVCWDSSATLLIGGSSKVADAFLAAYPSALDLDALNAERDRTCRST